MSVFRASAPVKIDGQEIRRVREEKGLTQLYVAEVVGVSVDTVSRWENNRTDSVRRENAEALAKAIEVELEQILKPTAPEGPVPAEIAGEDAGNSRWRRLAMVTSVLAVAGLGGWWWWAGTGSLQLEANRRLSAYATPGAKVPVVVKIRTVEGSARRLILRETLPSGWKLLGATPAPDRGPGSDGVVRWILEPEGPEVRVAYVVQSSQQAPESSIHRFAGEVVPPGKSDRAVPVRGENRIDLEFLHWADEDGDFQIGDSEVLDALERLEGLQGLGLEPTDLRKLWGEPEYEYDRGTDTFHPVP